MNIAAKNIRKRLDKLKATADLRKLNLTERATKHQDSMRAAINAKCFSCIGADENDPSWTERIRYCNSFACSLHPFRPLKPIQYIVL